MVASTRAYSMSGSSETASNNRCQTPAFTQSRKRVKMLFQWPNEGGRSRQGLPVRTTHKTASTNRRLSLPLRPGSPGLPQHCSFRHVEGLCCWAGFRGSAAMAGASAGLPAGVRLSDHISLGVIARAFPADQVRRVLSETGRASERERDLPAQVMVYHAIALALYMGSSTREVLRCLLEGLRWLWGAGSVKVAGRSGISQARTRLGEAPLRQLYKQMVRPIAMRATKGAWYRAWRLVSLDGSCLDVADTAGNGASCGYPGASRGESAFPQLRFVALVENGTHVLFGAQMGRYADGETTLAHDVLTALRPGMLCLADRQFFGYALWQAAAATGADLLWRVKHNLRLPRAAVLADGSYLTTIYPSDKDRRHGANGTRVRVVEYRLAGVAGGGPPHRPPAPILGPAQAPPPALGGAFPQRGGNQGGLGGPKKHPR